MSRRVVAALAAAVALVALGVPSARADFSPTPVPTPKPSPQRNFAVHVITVSSSGEQASEPAVPEDTGPPPVCVYGYAESPSEVKHFKDTIPHGIPYEDRPDWPEPDHIGDDGMGYFYEPSCAEITTPAEADAVEAWLAVHPEFVWVPNTGPFPADVVTPLRLAQIAADHVHVPDVTIHTNPTATAYTNLPTAVWVDRPDPKLLTATASLEGGDIGGESETVTASIDHIRLIAPGAATTPADGNCTGTGDRYDGGSSAPSCAVTWPTSSGGQPGQVFTATVQVVWSVTWSNGNLGGTTIPQQLTRVVDEIDSVNVGG